MGSSSGCSSREAVLLQHPPLDQGLGLDGHLIAPASPPLQYSDSVSYVGTVGQPVWGGFDSHHRPSTLDRHRRGQQSSSQSAYHTCDRRQPKKKVTIKEKPDDESEV